jgi:microcystin-dependent protein
MADSSPLLGSIMMFGGNFAPRGFMLCQGQILPISQYTALFAILGTTYGGNGTTTFALPDLQGRAPLQQGQGLGLPNYDLGEQTGFQSVTVLANQLAGHTHPINADTTGFANVQSPAGAVWSQQGDLTSPVNAYITGSPNATMNVAMCGPNTGGPQPVPIQNPLLGLNFIIAVQGIFPSRN